MNSRNGDTNGWSTESTGGKDAYSPFSFYTRSKDAQGHGSKIRITVPDYMLPQLNALKEAFPEHYRTHADIFRDSFRHRERFISNNMEEFAAIAETDMFAGMERADSMLARTEALQEFPHKVKKACQSLVDAGDKSTLRVYLKEQRKSAEEYNEPWQSKIMEVVEQFSTRWLDE